MITRKTRDGRPAPFAVNFTLLPALKPPDYGSYARVVCASRASGEAAGRIPEIYRYVQASGDRGDT